jgi:hypothetical protein
VPARYPMGSDKQLIQTLTGKEVPADARAAEVGVLVHNVSTCAAVHRALRCGEPLVERIVTVNGGRADPAGQSSWRRSVPWWSTCCALPASMAGRRDWCSAGR